MNDESVMNKCPDCVDGNIQVWVTDGYTQEEAGQYGIGEGVSTWTVFVDTSHWESQTCPICLGEGMLPEGKYRERIVQKAWNELHAQYQKLYKRPSWLEKAYDVALALTIYPFLSGLLVLIGSGLMKPFLYCLLVSLIGIAGLVCLSLVEEVNRKKYNQKFEAYYHSRKHEYGIDF